uniref:Potassium channel tetramerisation domain containing 18 n=1 Tax=Peromyscus maniculatus bairdii TaxID=230844 RepID=A0A8C8UR65_PERMB
KLQAKLESREVMAGHKAEELLDILRLNVGGCIYTARRESLCRFKDSMLASMFSGRFPLKTDESGVSYWRVPHELIECWTLEERPLHGSLRHMAPIRKRRLLTLREEDESVNCKTGPKPVRFLGPSTSTQIKVKNSASVRVSPVNAAQISSQATANRSQRGSYGKAAPCSVATGTSGHAPTSPHAQSAENQATQPPPGKVLLSEKKSPPHRVIKLRRTPLCVGPSLPTPSAGSQAGFPQQPSAEASIASGMRTESREDQPDG